MALTVTSPSSPGPIGPGFIVQVHNPAVGPIPSDDFIEVWLTVAGSQQICGMCMPSLSSHDPEDTMGVIMRTSYAPFSLAVDGRNLAFALTTAVSSGSAVGFHVNWRHSNHTLVDTYTDPGGWTWDPLTGLWSQAHRLNQNVQGANLAQILAAVQTTFPAT